MKKTRGVSLIALIITIIVIIILAAIVMVSSSGTIDEANFSGYAQELGDYTSAVTTTAASIKSSAAVEGLVLNDSQVYYMLAKGYSAQDLAKAVEYTNDNKTTELGQKIYSGDKAPTYKELYDSVMGKIVPGGSGYQMTESILRALDYNYNPSADAANDQKQIAAYIIEDDKAVNGYERAGITFYGNSNGTETHYVTSDGTVFTLPGFPREQSEDRSFRYYITPTAYYTVVGRSNQTPNSANSVEKDPIQAGDFKTFDALDATGLVS